jgi:hypothetical protein
VPTEQLPDSLPLAAQHPSATAYAFHLTTDLGGCAIPNPLLNFHLAHLGGTASTLPLLLLSDLIGDAVADFASWPTSPAAHLREAAATFLTIIALPSYHHLPARHFELLQAFTTALAGSDGKPSLANLGEVSYKHAQSCLTRIFNTQLFADLVADHRLPDLTRARLRAAAAFNAGRFLVPLALSRINRLSNMEMLTAV